MKLRITVDGMAYEVDVDVLDASGMPGGAGAASPGLITAPPVTAAPCPAAVPAPPAAAKPAPAPRSGGGGNGAKVLEAPIAGNVVAIKIKVGQSVQINQVLVVMEAMKMELNVASPVAGSVKAVRVNPGQAVKAGEVLLDFE